VAIPVGLGMAILAARRKLLPALLLGCAAAGILAGQPATERLAHGTAHPADAFLKVPVLVTARVSQRPVAGHRGWQARLHLMQVEHRRQSLPIQDEVFLYGDGTLPALLEGDRIRAWVHLSRRHHYLNGGPMPPYAGTLAARLKSHLLIEEVRHGSTSLTRIRGTARAFARHRLETAFTHAGADEKTGALTLALALGHRNRLDPRFTRHMQHAGMAHLLAISGLHLTALAGSLVLLLRLTGSGTRGTARVVMGALMAFSLVLPARPSVLRAVFMGTVPLGARLAGRRSDPMNSLGGIGLALVVWNPSWAGEPGFQLSFVVTAALIHHAGTSWPRGTFQRLKALLAVSFIATAASLPLTAWHFGLVVPGAIPVNFLAVPLAVILVVLAQVVLILALVSPVSAQPALYLMSLATSLLDRLAESAAHLPGGSWCVPQGPLLLTLAALAAVFLPSGLRRWRLPVVLLLDIILTAGCFPPAPLPTGSLSLRVLDVGQGDALLLGLPDGGAVLVDGGGQPGTSADFGRRVLLPALANAGVRRLRAIALTHPHEDHGGGLRAVLEDLPVDELWLPRLDGVNPLLSGLQDRSLARNIPILVMRRGTTRTLGGARFTCLAPFGRAAGERANLQSMVLRVESEHGSFLLTGDLEAGGEIRMVAGEMTAVDILKVPHHGSRTSSTAELLDASNPALAIISVGSSNPWEHPHGEVMERLRDRGIGILRTDEDGAITVTAGPQGITACAMAGFRCLTATSAPP
jgi:competence protein ComEC